MAAPAARESEEDTDGPADMEASEVLACSFSAWYESFARVTFKSEVIPLPEDFVQYLLADGIEVPLEKQRADDSSSDGSGSPRNSVDHDSAGAPELEVENFFPELLAEVKAAIDRLKGGVLPKLNWSAPKDTQWVHGSLRCTSTTEVITLLKASDFVSHDLCNAFDHCGGSSGGTSASGGTRRSRPDQFTLVLRQWHNGILESGEFRCFVRDSVLLGISQRQISGFFEHLVQEDERQELLRVIQDFFELRVRGTFPLTRYAFDIYVGSAPRRRVWLVDFSPWGASTEPCLYSWEELTELPTVTATDIRVVASDAQRRGTLSRYHNIPVELANLSMGEGLEELIQKADRLLQEKEKKSCGG